MPMPRPSARQRGYTSKWDKEAAAYKRQHPLCCMCKALGRITPTAVVDHISPHKGDPKLFWDRTNWQPLCAEHHNRDKQLIEKRGYNSSTDEQGNPIDPNHPWNT